MISYRLHFEEDFHYTEETCELRRASLAQKRCAAVQWRFRGALFYFFSDLIVF